MKSAVITDPQEIKNLLSRGIEEVFIRESLEKKLSSGIPLRVKFGIDPTSRNVHLGRAVPLRILRRFQKLGHIVVIIIGDFTAQIGDPSDKINKRPMLSREEIKENLSQYLEQVGKILDLSKVEIHYNASWLEKLGFQEISQLAESFSVQQMTARRNFSERLEKGEEISLREFLYPLMQGYDSVAVKADIEIGGTDQLFNLKAGRIIQKHYHMPEQDIITTMMLEGTDGRKMSSSWGNVISLLDNPNDMYGKLMAVRDELVSKYFLLCTDATAEETGITHPKDLKMRLAREIVSQYHGIELAEKAEASFIATFSKGEVPTDIVEIHSTTDEKLGDVLVREGVVISKSDWRRLVDEGAVSFVEINQKITDPFINCQSGTVRIGKKRFVRIAV